MCIKKHGKARTVEPSVFGYSQQLPPTHYETETKGSTYNSSDSRCIVKKPVVRRFSAISQVPIVHNIKYYELWVLAYGGAHSFKSLII